MRQWGLPLECGDGNKEERLSLGGFLNWCRTGLFNWLAIGNKAKGRVKAGSRISSWPDLENAINRKSGIS